MGRSISPRLPYAPIAIVLPGFTANQVAERCGVARRTVVRWIEVGIAVRQADEIACGLGTHPLLLWGEAWTDAEIELERIVDEKRRLKRESRKAREQARRDGQKAWRFMESRWRQWVAQQEREAA